MNLVSRYICILFVLCCAEVSAQVPGYQGRRMMIGYRNYLNFPLINANANGSIALNGLLYGFADTETKMDSMIVPLKFKPLALQFTHALSFSYVMTRRRELQVDFRFYKAGLVISDYGFEPPYSTYTPYIYMRGTVTTFTSVGIDLAYRKYFYRLAPFNFYSTYVFGIEFLSGTSPERYYPDKVPSKKISGNAFRLAYQVGRNTVLSDRLLLDIGFSLNFTALVFMDGGPGSGSNTFSVRDRGEMIARASFRDAMSFYSTIKYMIK